MSKKIDKNNLGYLGVDFQFKLVKTFVEDPRFFTDIYHAVDQNMFTDPNLKVFVGVLKEYVIKHDVVPSYKMMEILLLEKAKTEIDSQFYKDIIKQIKETSSEGVLEIKEMSEKFFLQQNIVKAANEILKIAGDGDINKYNVCAKLMEDALNVGSHEDFGVSVFDNIEEVLSDEYRITIPTGIGKIDETLEGGIGKGELGIIIGPTSFGKTSLTTAMASYAATYKCETNDNKGFKVLQIVFEDRQKQIQRKHIGRLTGVEAKDLSKPDYIDAVKETLEKYGDREILKENLRIKKFPSGEITPTKLKQFIRALINTGFKPDLAIIDYFECMEPDKDKGFVTDNEFSKEGRTMRTIETLAEEFNIGIWVPTQGTKDSIGIELVTMDKAGGSVKKIQIGHIIMSIARTMSDIEKNIATIAILKNRAGKAGKRLNGVEFNNGTCRISTDNVIEFDSMMEAAEEDRKKMATELSNTARQVFNEVKKEKS